MGLWLFAFALWSLGGCQGSSAEPPSRASQAKAANPSAAPAAAERHVSGPKVAFLGDSISAGLHLPADQAFPAVLQRRLTRAGHAFQLINAGVSGDTSAGGLRRVDWILKQQPDLVVIELGGNDGLRGVSLQSIEQNLLAIIAKVREAGAKPLLLGVRLPPSYGKEYAAKFDAIYPRIARELDVPLVPFFMKGVAGVPEMNLQDALHPTAQGHQRLADNVQPALLQALVSLQ